MKQDIQYFRQLYESMSSDEILLLNKKNDEEHQKQYSLFQAYYSNEKCYLCHKPFKTISFGSPCLHWLLRQCKFRKKDFMKVYEAFGYLRMAAFLWWCANQEKFLSNINDLEVERDSHKIINYTIRWKNIECTFDCSQNDFKGHMGTCTDFPHFHFQMRIDGQQFIN